MDIQEDLVRHYRWLREHGINDSHSGNASARDGATVWVTPTGACADTLQAADLIPCRLDAPIPAGASLDTALHLAVYRRQPEARAVLHSHGPHTVAMTFDGKDFIPPDFEGQYYFSRIPVADIPYGRYVEQAPEVVSCALAGHPIMVVRGHGVYAWGKTINLAYKWSCSLELSTKTAFLARLAGTLT